MTTTGNSWIVVDTNVLSYLFRPDPIRGPRYAQHLVGSTVGVSFQTVEEMLFGAYKAGWGSGRLARLDAFIKRFVVVGADREVAEHCARVRADSEAEGHSIEIRDAWIAATALKLGCPLVTHNVKDFAHIASLKTVTEPDP